MTAIVAIKFTQQDECREKRRSQLGSCDYPTEDGVVSIRLSTVGIIVAISLVIRLLHDEERELQFWFDQLPDLQKKLAGREATFYPGPGWLERPHSHACVGTQGNALRTSKSCQWKILSRSSQENMLQLSWMRRSGMTYDSLIKLLAQITADNFSLLIEIRKRLNCSRTS